MERTEKQQQNIDDSTARMQVSDAATKLSDIANDLDNVIETTSLTYPQRVYLTNALGTIQNISRELAQSY